MSSLLTPVKFFLASLLVLCFGSVSLAENNSRHMVIIADASFVSHYQAQGVDPERVISAAFSHVHQIFASQVGVTLTLRRTYALTQTTMFDSAQTSGELIDILKDVANAERISERGDIIVLLTRNESQQIGWGAIGDPLCNSYSGAGHVAYVRDPLSFGHLVQIFAHEVGHLFGAQHPAPGPQEAIMRGLNMYAPAPDEFLSINVERMKADCSER